MLPHSVEGRLEHLNTPGLNRMDQDVAAPSVRKLQLLTNLVRTVSVEIQGGAKSFIYTRNK